MKKNSIYAGLLLLGMAVTTGCSNEESLEQVMNNGNTFEAVIENVEARTSVNDTYQVLWTEDDQFDVWNGTEKAATLTLSEGNGTISGKFTIDNSNVTLTSDMIALFPTSGSKSYTFKTSYDSQETDAPMSATFAEGKFTFSLLTAMVRVVVTNVPQGDALLTITSSDKTLTGEAALGEDGTLEMPTGDGKTVTVTIAGNTASTLTFDIPVPAQEYANGLNATLKVGNVEVFNKTTVANFTPAVGKLYKFDAVANEVTSSEELASALSNGGNIVLGSDITLADATTSLNIAENTTATIDLNGNSLTLGSQTIEVGNGATLNLVNNATATTGRSTSEGVTISSSTDIIKAANGSKINIGAGVNLETSGANASCIWIPAGAGDVTVTSSGNLKCTSAGAAVISHNGTLTSGTINIKGGSVEHSADVAIYIAGKAALNISGDAKIKGTTGVEIRAGELNVTGGTITATAETFSATANNNGSTSVGAAVAVTQHSTNHDLKVAISGGTFTGAMALYEEDTCDDSVDKISMTVTGGTFNGQVSSENCQGFITKGTFSDASAFNYLGEGADVTLGADSEITKAISITGKATIDLNGHTIENKTAASTTGLDSAEDECIVFFVNGESADLTINATNGGAVKATGDEGEDAKSYYNVAVWAMNSANVTINGGEFTNTADPIDDGCDLIYGRNGAKISITGGTFKAGAVRQTLGGIYAVLNCKDVDETAGIAQSTITLSGGKFYEFGSEQASKVGSGEVVLTDGCKWSEQDSDDYYSVVTE